MADYKIIIPIENDEEEKQLREVAESFEGATINISKTRKLDGGMLVDLVIPVEHIINFAGALVTLYVFFRGKRVKIIDDKNNVKNNIKMIDLENYIKNNLK